jgi:hypothetical protein
MVMFMRPRAADAPELPQLGRLTNGVVGVTVALILIFGFAPSQVLRQASRSALRPPDTAPAFPMPPAADAAPAAASGPAR